MRSFKFTYCFLVSLLFLCSFHGKGKEPVKDTIAPPALKIDKQAEQEIFSEDSYMTGTQSDKSNNEGFMSWLLRTLFGNMDARTMSVVGHIIFYALIILFIGGIVFIVMKMNGGKLFRGQSSKTSVFSDINEDIASIDVDGLVKQAVDSGDYRLAFRYSYLKSLQLMSNLELIDWKPYKTNYEYYMEFKKQSARPLFRDLYTGFEYVWYGDAPLSIELYEKYRGEFTAFNRQLSV